MGDEANPTGRDETLCHVQVAENRFQADIILKALEREGIAAMCRCHEEVAYDGIFVPQRGWGAILVPLTERDRAMEIIREILEIYAQKGHAP